MCNTKFKVPPRGRFREYCSARCRQRAYESRKWSRPKPVEALAADLAHVQVRSWLRQEIWTLLVEAGVIPAKTPMPTAKPKQSKDHLRLVPPQT
jgi:hypothetical protein